MYLVNSFIGLLNASLCIETKIEPGLDVMIDPPMALLSFASGSLLQPTRQAAARRQRLDGGHEQRCSPRTESQIAGSTVP